MDTFDNLNKPKTDLFIQSQEWLVKSFSDADNVIQFADKEEGVMMGRYLLTSHTIYDFMGEVNSTSNIDAVIDIRVKDDKARIAILPLGKVTYRGKENIFKELAEDHINMLINDYRRYINGSAVDF